MGCLGQSWPPISFWICVLILWVPHRPCVFEGLFDFRCPPIELISEVQRQLYLACPACGDRKANRGVGGKRTAFSFEVSTQSGQPEEKELHRGRENIKPPRQTVTVSDILASESLHLSVCFRKNHSSASSTQSYVVFPCRQDWYLQPPWDNEVLIVLFCGILSKLYCLCNITYLIYHFNNIKNYASNYISRTLIQSKKICII